MPEQHYTFLPVTSPVPRRSFNLVGSLRDREVACTTSDRQGPTFVSCVWMAVSACNSSPHPHEVILAKFSLYVHKGGLRIHPFHFICFWSNSHTAPVSKRTSSCTAIQAQAVNPAPLEFTPAPQIDLRKLLLYLNVIYNKASVSCY